MGLFNFLNRQKESGKAMVAMLPVAETKDVANPWMKQLPHRMKKSRNH